MMMAMANPIDIKVGTPASITLTTPRQHSIDIDARGGGADGEPYAGPYEVTPTRETQVLHTAHKVASRNIVVKPIPPNYGLITWDGSVLTVS